MNEKIDETLKRLAAGISSGKVPNYEKEDSIDKTGGNVGDLHCPFCGGLGYLRAEVPIDHPDFGKLQVCTCRHGEIAQQVRRRLYSLSNLEELGHLTFDNFNPRGRLGLWPHQASSLEMAYNQAKHFAQNLNGWLLLQGDYGSGKTHLAAAIANFAVSMGVPTLFITVPDLLDTLRYAYEDPEATFEQRFNEIRQAPLLVMDDFGTQSGTAWAQEKLFQIINHRYINRLPLVVTTNLSLRDIDGRIRSRLEDPELVTIVHILAPDYRRPVGDLGHHELSSPSLLHNCTFANFDLRKGDGLPEKDLQSLEEAFLAARRFAQEPQGWIVFSGPFGCGKTHLAAAIANFRADMGHPPLFVVVPDLLDHLRSTFNPASTVSLDRRFEAVRITPLLVLDDLGTQSTTPWVKEKLYQLFNYRYVAELPTVITTSDYREEMDARLLSRMEDRRVSEIHALSVPSYRGAAAKEGRRGGRKRRSV